MTRAFRFALAMASIITVVAGGTIGASQAGRMDQMGQMNDFKPYTAEAVKAAMGEGKTTLLFFHAPWCPVCKNVVAFKVDYDSNMALRKELKVDKQSTLILYQGMKEVARLSYKSDDESIAQFFNQAPMAMSEAR